MPCMTGVHINGLMPMSVGMHVKYSPILRRMVGSVSSGNVFFEFSDSTSK